MMLPIVTAVMVMAPPAWAQSERRAGLVVAYPTSIGVLWHVTDGIALRPDLAVNWQSTETTSTITGVIGPLPQTSTSTTTGWNSSVGLSALFYVGSPGDLRFYLTPRVAYGWSRTETENTPPSQLQLTSYESKTDGVLVAGSFGAQYKFHDRFEVFGEVGVSYSDQDGETAFTVSRQTLSTTNVGLRSGVGVTVYF